MGAAARGWLNSLAGYESLVINADGRGWSTRGFKDLQGALPVTTPG
jgi:hypothetical protein